MQAEREIQRANFFAKPENYALQLEIKQRNDRTKVEMFKLFKQKRKTLAKEPLSGFAKERRPDPFKFLYQKETTDQ